MEDDRYQKNHFLFIIGLVSLLLALSLFVLTLYLLPHLLFGWLYNIPEFILFWIEWLQSQYNVTEVGASQLIILFFFLLSLFFATIAYFSSNRIDSQIFNLGSSRTRKPITFKKSSREGLALGLKILFIMIIVFVAASLFQWLLYNT